MCNLIICPISRYIAGSCVVMADAVYILCLRACMRNTYIYITEVALKLSVCNSTFIIMLCVNITPEYIYKIAQRP